MHAELAVYKQCAKDAVIQWLALAAERIDVTAMPGVVSHASQNKSEGLSGDRREFGAMHAMNSHAF
jgi:hypothetical protein